MNSIVTNMLSNLSSEELLQIRELATRILQRRAAGRAGVDPASDSGVKAESELDWPEKFAPELPDKLISKIPDKLLPDKISDPKLLDKLTPPKLLDKLTPPKLLDKVPWPSKMLDKITLP